MEQEPRDVGRLLRRFESSLKYFEKDPPFNKPDQLQSHVRTMRLRKKLGGVRAALLDNCFLESLLTTLGWWGGNARGKVLVDLDTFRRQLWACSDEIAALEGVKIHRADGRTGDAIWQIVQQLSIRLDEKTREPILSKLVYASKALHHLLPNLVVPIDRVYIGGFFDRSGKFQPPYEAKTFSLAFQSFLTIARKANPAQYVHTHAWHTSPTKVIDNAIVGFVKRLHDRNLREAGYITACRVRPPRRASWPLSR
jgi:hypothetical protein